MDGVTIERSLDLSAATSATLTLDYREINGNEQIAVQLFDGITWNTRRTLNGSGSITYNLSIAERNANAGIRFISNSGGWGNSEEYRIDNVLFTATLNTSILISDITVNEGAGTATFTARHVGPNTLGPFNVNYSTLGTTAIADLDFTTTAGTMSFTGISGDTEVITVPILEDILYESSENFEVRMSFVSDPSVNITSVGVGTINDNETVLGNSPLVLTEEFDGYMDYATTGGTLRTLDNNTDPCAIGITSSNTLTSQIPAGATIERAILYWSNSGAMDPLVTFEGQNVFAQLVYRTTILGLEFHNQSADVTAMLQAMPDPSTNVFDFTDLTIDNTGNYCSYGVTLGGWSLMVFYTHPSLPASTINLYQGFDGNQNSTSTFTLSGFYAIGSTGSKTTVLSWEGDQTLANNESLEFNTPLTGNNLLTGDGDNTTGNNPFNSTIYDNVGVPVTNDAAQYGVDLDTYDVSALIVPGETSATTVVNVGQDFVMMNVVLLKVPSNIIVGNVFEDINYGGSAGRDRATAGGVGIPNATVELYDNLGVLINTSTTNASGQYTFAGMQNGDYTIRVVNSSVRSTRPGGSGCAVCLPVQTFKADYTSSTLTPYTNLVGGNDPSAQDPAVGILTGAQSTSAVSIVSEGVVGVDFGFSFNTIVNTNEAGQGSLEQFIVNSNNIGEGTIDIEANGLFDPAAGTDYSVFMIPPTGDALGRAADANYAGGIFNISLSSSSLSDITGDNTVIDGRTQTAYSGDSNSGSIGAGGTAVGIGGTILPVYDLPEIQVHDFNGNTFINEGNTNIIRNLSIYANDLAGILVNNGSLTIFNNLIGVDALGANGGTILYGVQVSGGASTIDSNYLSTNFEAGILIDGGTATTVQNNHLIANGNNSCSDNITITGGSGVVIRQNLLEQSAAMGIDGNGIAGGVTITENSITSAGQNGGLCSGALENAGIRLDGSNSSITNNNIYENGGAGIVLAGGNTSGNLISQNSIYANGTAGDALGIDLDQADGMGDGITLNDLGDVDVGPNGAANFPIITTAYIEGPNLILKGWSRPGANIEVFLTDTNEGTATEGDNQLGMSTDYGEGQIYIGSAIEGSASDLDAGSSLYTDTDGNTDNTNQFHLQIPYAPSLAIGFKVTATATLANSTSEFSPVSVIKIRSVITNRRITYRVNQN